MTEKIPADTGCCWLPDRFEQKAAQFYALPFELGYLHRGAKLAGGMRQETPNWF
jgi:hypothetical protein